MRESGECKVVLLRSGRWKQTAVSNAFIDGYMADANGEFVKVYLYLLRLLDDRDMDFSVSFLADRLNNTEKDVLRALCYWEKLGLLRLTQKEDGSLSSVMVLDVPEQKTKAPAPRELENAGEKQEKQETQMAREETAAARSGVAEEVVSCPPDILARMQEEDDFQEIIFAAERYLGRTLSARDVELFGYMRETLQFPSDLIEYLIEYCVDGGHRSYRYMEKVALGWHQDGIRTLRQAKEANRVYRKENKAVMKAFGISGRVLTSEERKLLEIWLREDGMSLPVIVEACGRTMKAIHTPSFEYTDRIIKAWKAAGISTVEEARAYYEKQKAERRRGEKVEAPSSSNRFHNFDQRNTDYDALLMQEEKELYGANKSTV